MEQEGKRFWRYGVIVQGVKNRCRKNERHNFDKLGESDTLDPLVAVRLAQEAIRKEMKVVTKAHATATRWTLIDSQTERWSPFDKEDNLQYEVSL